MSSKSKKKNTSKNSQQQDYTQLTRAERNSTLKKIGIVVVCILLALAMTVPSFTYLLS